jgi:hypothetical protein
VLVEHGFVRVSTGDGSEWTFAPSLARIAALGEPKEIVDLYVHDLHDPAHAPPATCWPRCASRTTQRH